MSSVSKFKDFWESHNIHFEPLEDDKLYRIVHLRDAYFLDDMYFRGMKAAQDYLDLHMSKVAQYKLDSKYHYVKSDDYMKSRLSQIIDNNQRIHFDIVEV